jgi:hypothetical protein
MRMTAYRLILSLGTPKRYRICPPHYRPANQFAGKVPSAQIRFWMAGQVSLEVSRAQSRVGCPGLAAYRKLIAELDVRCARNNWPSVMNCRVLLALCMMFV